MKKERRLIAGLALVLALLSVNIVAFAQEAPKSPPKPGDVIIEEDVVVGPHRQGIMLPKAPLPPGEDTIVFLSSEMSFDGKVVKNAPYSAQAVTETTRTLNDGNRIKRKTSASIYRDSEGRTRREEELGAIGPWAVSGEQHQTIFINDPVSGINYILDPRTRTARKMPPLRLSLSPGEIHATSGNGSKVRVEREVFTAPAPPAGDVRIGIPPMQEFHIVAGPQKGETESLGKQTIEGVMAEGTRTTMTIPAGEVGNEQAINIVWEKWYSPELQTVVMSKHSDPFVGETIYRLTNIVRGEQARTLFEVPGDYTIKDAPMRTRTFRKKQGEEK